MNEIKLFHSQYKIYFGYSTLYINYLKNPIYFFAYNYDINNISCNLFAVLKCDGKIFYQLYNKYLISMNFEQYLNLTKIDKNKIKIFQPIINSQKQVILEVLLYIEINAIKNNKDQNENIIINTFNNYNKLNNSKNINNINYLNKKDEEKDQLKDREYIKEEEEEIIKENERFKKERNNKKGDNNEDINELKKQNLNLRNEIEQLKDKLNEERNKNQKLTLKLEELKNILNKEKKDFLLFQKRMSEKITELDKYYNKKLEKFKSIFPFKISEDDKIITTIFMTSDENIHYPMICKSTEIFIELEKRLYIKYPEYKEKQNNYYANGHKIDIKKTLDDNKIKRQ